MKEGLVGVKVSAEAGKNDEGNGCGPQRWQYFTCPAPAHDSILLVVLGNQGGSMRRGTGGRMRRGKENREGERNEERKAMERQEGRCMRCETRKM